MNFAIKKILQFMQTNELIENEDIELYQYGIHLMFLKFVHYCSILVLGFFLGRVGELIIFLTCYTLLRAYTGGYHAKHSITCLFISIAMILCIHMTIDLLTHVTVFVITILSAITILIFAPIPSKEKILEEDEMKRNRKISIILSILLVTLFITLSFTNLRGLYYSIGYSLFYTSFYLLIPIGREMKGRVVNE